MSVVVYHYTSVEGLNAIERSGFIKESKRSVADAVHGDGIKSSLCCHHHSKYCLCHHT